MLKKIMRSLIAALILQAPLLFAQVDINVGQIGPYATLVNPGTWTGSGVGTFGNNYLLTPTNPDSGVCVSVHNLDTAAHFFNVGVAVSADPHVTTYKGNTGRWQTVGATSALNNVNYVAASATQSYFFKLSGAARIAIILSNSTPSTGSASAYIVQTTEGGCASTPFPIEQSLTRFSANAYGMGTSFIGAQCTTNPGNGYPLLFVTSAGSGPFTFTSFDRVRVSSTAVADIEILGIANAGVGCSNGHYQNSQLQSSNASQNIVGTGTCTTNPTGSPSGILDEELIGANAPVSVDLSGTWFAVTSGSGYEVSNRTAVTGTICINIFWSEQ